MTSLGPAAEFTSAFRSFLTGSANIGIYPSHFSSRQIFYGLIEEDMGMVPLVLAIPAARIKRESVLPPAPALPRHALLGLSLDRLLASQGMSNFNIERAHLQRVVDEAHSNISSSGGDHGELRQRAEELDGAAARTSIILPGDAAADGKVDRSRSVLDAIQRQVESAILYLYVGRENDLRMASYKFGKAAVMAEGIGRYGAAAMLAQAGGEVEDVRGATFGPENLSEASDAEALRTAECVNILRSLRTDPDPATFGFRIFMGIADGWGYERCARETEGILAFSAMWNFAHDRQTAAAADLARMALTRLEAPDGGSGERLEFAAEMIDSAVRIWDANDMDESIVGQARRFVYEARTLAPSLNQPGA
ncbi:MAG: hypothetical protein JXA24_01415 [Proteobacteria bacterium]|nr:hypothetical protein [Pseudomonadota bacterium]